MCFDISDLFLLVFRVKCSPSRRFGPPPRHLQVALTFKSTLIYKNNEPTLLNVQTGGPDITNS
ncbi:hypothetical protein Hanom_Chr15g01403541 [Helianthus anomalus]